MSNNIKLIGSDIGGTLTDKKGKISEYTANIIKQLKIPFCFITGYNRYVSYKYIDALNLENYYLIAQNGSFCYYNKNLIFSNLLPFETAEKAVEFATNNNCIARIFCTDNHVYCIFPKNYTDKPKRWDNYIYKVFDDSLNNLPSKIIQVGIFEKIEKIQNIENKAKEKFKNNFISGPLLFGTHKWVEFNNKLASKGQAFQQLAIHLNIDLKNTIYFGDNYNDIDILEKAGVAAVVNDAHQDIKKYADIIVKEGYNNGVAKFLQENFIK